MQGFDKKIVDFIQEHSLLTAGSRILIACSGGVDSMILLHFLAINSKKLQIEVGAVHVDHMLRGEESAAEGRFVKKYCEKLAIPFYGGSVPVPDIIKQTGGNVQTICREGRYAYFVEMMHKHRFELLATGHHAEDQLETVLMQVTKGNTPLGMPIKRKLKTGMLIRPFLPVEKAALYAYAKVYDVPFREDPSNQSDDYMRNRYRHSIVPQMAKENKSVAQKIVPLTDELQQDEAFLRQLTKEHLRAHVQLTEEGFPTMNVKQFNSMPTALQRRAIPLLLDYLYKENRTISYKSDLIRQLLEHLRSQEGNVSINLPLGFCFIREYDMFSLIPKESSAEFKQIILPKGEKVIWDHHFWLYWEKVSDVNRDLLSCATEITFFNLAKESLPLVVRQRKEGDRILLPGMNRAKRLSRLFIDEKVSHSLRDRLPIVVTQQEEVCAVPGLRYGRDFIKQQTADSKYIFVVGIN